MTMYIFAGPTLSAEEGELELDATFLPPAAQGDVYRAALDKPWAIGIIDGYFERIPSVSHKEVLWAMSQGIHVFGSASMGALRAAELALFGMEGVGAVYQAFMCGEIEADDEVAVAHAPAEQGYRAVSEAMVNLRATLKAAAKAGVLSEGARAALERIAKELFYADRCYPMLFWYAQKAGIDPGELGALKAFLPRGRVNQKREDALAMLRHMRARFEESQAPKRVRYAFEHTDAWEYIRSNVSRKPVSADASASVTEALIEELKVAGAFAAARKGALARALALDAARRQGRAVQGAALLDAVDGFRRDRGLFTPEAFQRWLADQRIEDPERFFQSEAQVRWVETMFEADVARNLPDFLRRVGEYGPLLGRALDKQRVLAELGPRGARLAEAGETEEGLVRWYFEERLGRPVPQDLAGYAREAGFADAQALRRAALAERCYLRRACPRP